jgi:class 3 adenylate cyclase
MFMPYGMRLTYSATQQRLEQLIQERLAPGADQAAIDARIWDMFGEDWAVMFTDLSGFSRSVADFGIIHFLQVIHESLRILTPCLDRHDGVLLKVEADSLMVTFRSPVRALECAVAMQRACRDYNQGRPETDKVLLCVGLGFGHVLRVGEHDVFGAEVNAASKLGEDTAKSWEILVTDSLRAAVAAHVPHTFDKIPTPPAGTPAAYRVAYTL